MHTKKPIIMQHRRLTPYSSAKSLRIRRFCCQSQFDLHAELSRLHRTHNDIKEQLWTYFACTITVLMVVGCALDFRCNTANAGRNASPPSTVPTPTRMPMILAISPANKLTFPGNGTQASRAYLTVHNPSDKRVALVTVSNNHQFFQNCSGKWDMYVMEPLSAEKVCVAYAPQVSSVFYDNDDMGYEDANFRVWIEALILDETATSEQMVWSKLKRKNPRAIMQSSGLKIAFTDLLTTNGPQKPNNEAEKQCLCSNQSTLTSSEFMKQLNSAVKKTIQQQIFGAFMASTIINAVVAGFFAVLLFLIYRYSE